MSTEKGVEPNSPGVSPSRRSWPSECVGTTMLDETRKMSASRASCSEFLEKARAPMATEEFERILKTEREYWSASCLEEVRALQKAVCAVQQQAAADRAEAEAVRASMRDLRAEGESSTAAGGARLALLEATCAQLREALQAEREQRGDELRKAEERLRAELATARAAHESAMSAARREDDGGRVDGKIAALQSDVARLQAASDKGSEDLQLTRGAVDSANRRISELVTEQAQTCERISRLDDTQAQALAVQGGIREAVAERALQSQGDLRQTQEAVQELQAEVRRLTTSAKEQEKGPRYVAPDTRMQDRAVEELRAEVSGLKASTVEQGRREEFIAQKAGHGMAELKADLSRFQRGLERVERRVEEMAEVGAESSRAADGGTDVRVNSLQRLVQDQRRELSVLSSELGSLRERQASEAGHTQQALGAIQASMEEERCRRAGRLGDAAGARAASGQHQRVAVCERVAEIESRTPRGQQEDMDTSRRREALPTLLATARSDAAADAEDAKPDAGAADAEAGAVPVGLMDSLHGVVAAVQKVLQDDDARRGPAAAADPPSAPPSAPPSPRHAQLPARPLAAVPAPAWRAQQPQRLAVPQPRAQSRGPALARRGGLAYPPSPMGQHAHGGTVQVAQGVPLLFRR